MSSTQINSTTNKVMTKTVSSSNQNFQLINGLTTIVDSNAKITDLLSTTTNSDTQTLLASTKTIMDYAIARGLATINVVQVGQYDASGNSDANGGYDVSGNVQAASILFNYNQYYANSPSTTSNLTLYQIDYTYFYVYSATAINNYTPKTNLVLYNDGAITNSTYITEVNQVISSQNQCLSLIGDISSTIN